jgi:hypothetical protein
VRSEMLSSGKKSARQFRTLNRFIEDRRLALPRIIRANPRAVCLRGARIPGSRAGDVRDRQEKTRISDQRTNVPASGEADTLSGN